MLILVMTAAVKKLRPPQCENGVGLCIKPSESQLGVLYIGLALASLGLAGTRFTVGTIGADQFDKPKHRGIFFNWYIFVMYICTVISATVIVYIQDSVSWAWGFGICVVANTLGLALFVAGTGFYRRFKPQGSPFTGLARVVIAATRKRNLLLSQNTEDYCQDPETTTFVMPTKFFK